MNKELREKVYTIISEHDRDWQDSYLVTDELITLIRTATLDEVKETIDDSDMLEKKYDECTSALGNQYIRGRIKKTRDAIKSIDDLRGNKYE